MSGERFFLMLSLILACSAQLSCTKIKCGINKAPICYSYNATTNSAVSSRCAEGYYCPFQYWAKETNYVCIAQSPPVITYSSLPGEKCNSTMQCMNGVNCVNTYCEGLANGASCIKTAQCAPGFYCAGDFGSGICVALRSPGATCKDNIDECTYGYQCNMGTCQKMFSIASGSAVDPRYCSGGSSLMCTTFQCALSQDLTAATCINAYVNIADPNSPCTSCTGTSTTGDSVLTATMGCLCGLSGVSYCPGFFGDLNAVNLINIAMNYLLGNDVKKCNILAGVNCLRSHGSTTSYSEFAYYSFMAFNGWRIIGADICVYDSLDPDYTYVLHEYQDEESGEFLVISALVFSLVA